VVILIFFNIFCLQAKKKSSAFLQHSQNHRSPNPHLCLFTPDFIELCVAPRAGDLELSRRCSRERKAAAAAAADNT